MGQLGGGELAGPGGVVDRPGGVGGRSRRPGVVVGQRRHIGVEAAGVGRFDRLGHPPVEHHPPRRRQTVVERHPHEGMGKAVPAGDTGSLPDETGRRRLLQR